MKMKPTFFCALLLCAILASQLIRASQDQQRGKQQQQQQQQHQQQQHQQQQQQWTDYKKRFGKIYKNLREDARRRNNFLANMRLIKEYNRDGEQHSIELGPNGMSDWYDYEFSQVTGVLNNGSSQTTTATTATTADSSSSSSSSSSTMASIGQQVYDEGSDYEPCTAEERDKFLAEFGTAHKPLPDELDWRTDPSRVGPVKKQQKCGSCWAHAATGVLEGQQVSNNFTREVVPLSEQQLLDCSNWNCLGGGVTDALAHISLHGGIQSSASYPYEAEKLAQCYFDETKSVMDVKCALALENLGAERIKTLLANYGPLAVALTMPNSALFYKSGILTSEQCAAIQRREQNHEALLVGYGIDPKYGDFWIVKNSHGRNWGEDGYFRIARGENSCRIEETVFAARI